MKCRTVIFLKGFFLLVILFAAFSYCGISQSQAHTGPLQAPPGVSDWPQVQNNPQRTGFTSQKIGSGFPVLWTLPFQPETVIPQVQAIVYSGKVFVGTENGNLYAINATNGDILWKYNVGAPILSSVAAGNGFVYLPVMDGAIYAFDAQTGSLQWKRQLSQRLGFSTSPVLMEGRLLLGGRNGIFYGLNAKSGSVLWSIRIGAPILMTAAADQGRVIFGAMDMSVYALNIITGAQLWKTEPLPVMAFKDYWPVIWNNEVILRPMIMSGLSLAADQAGMVIDQNIQEELLEYYDNYIDNEAIPLSLYRFDIQTGIRLPAVVHYNNQTMNGATAPPCVDRDGLLVMPTYYPEGTYSFGWGRLDPDKRIFVDVLVDTSNPKSGRGNPDENMNLTCVGNGVLAIHTQESNAQFTGAFNYDTRHWVQIERGYTNRQLMSNTQGGGGNPASIANNMVFHISVHELVARAIAP